MDMKNLIAIFGVFLALPVERYSRCSSTSFSTLVIFLSFYQIFAEILVFIGGTAIVEIFASLCFH